MTNDLENEHPLPLPCDLERPIPPSWRDHYGEEAFADISVYVQYGDKTPEEAVVILGLKPIPPPEKRVEPKQVKPSVEIVNQKEPDKKGEVKSETKGGEKMEEKTKLFPNSDFQGQGSKEFFDKTTFPETIEFTTPLLKGETQRGLMSIKTDELPGFIADRLEGAFRTSHSGTCEVMDWYIGVADGGSFFDRAALREMRNFRSELANAEDYGERKAILEKTVKYLRGMRVQKKV